MSTPKILRAKIEYENMININTTEGEIRLILNPDGTLRLITDIKVDQGKDLDKTYGKYQRLIQVESFRYPSD